MAGRFVAGRFVGGRFVGVPGVHPNWFDGQQGCSQLSTTSKFLFQQFYFTNLYFIWIKLYFKLPKTNFVLYEGLPY